MDRVITRALRPALLSARLEQLEQLEPRPPTSTAPVRGAQ